MERKLCIIPIYIFSRGLGSIYVINKDYLNKYVQKNILLTGTEKN